MIEEIALPIDTMFSGDELFPVLDGCCHSRFAWERHDRVQMIRHKQAQAAMPDESLVVEAHRGEHGIASVRGAFEMPGGAQLMLTATSSPRLPTADLRRLPTGRSMDEAYCTLCRRKGKRSRQWLAHRGVPPSGTRGSHASTASPMSARHNWFLPGGAQLMVTRNQLASATHCGIV